MKRNLLIFAALAACTACAQSARLGSLGRNDMVVTNIGTIARAESYGTETQWTDATGCVWRVVDAHYGEWSFIGVPEGFVFGLEWQRHLDAWQWTFERLGGGEGYAQDYFYAEDDQDTALDIPVVSDAFSGTIQCRRSFYPYGTNLVGRTALTNDISEIGGAVEDLRIESALIYRLYSGSNVVAEVTNYNSQVHAPSLRLLQINESNEYVTVWTETNGLSRTLNSAKEYTDDATNALRDVYAPRGWSATTSGSTRSPTSPPRALSRSTI